MGILVHGDDIRFKTLQEEATGHHRWTDESSIVGAKGKDGNSCLRAHYIHPRKVPMQTK